MTDGTQALSFGDLFSRTSGRIRFSLCVFLLFAVLGLVRLGTASAAESEKLLDGKYQLVLGAGSGHFSCTTTYTDNLTEKFEVVKGRVKQRRRPVIHVKMKDMDIYGDRFNANFLGPLGIQGPNSVRMEGRRVGNGFQGQYIAGTGGDNCRGEFKLSRESDGPLLASDDQKTPDVSSAAPVTDVKEPELQRVGTGFYVSSMGHLVTNKHVVAECNSLEVQPVGKPAVVARVVTSDKLNDLSLIHTDETSTAFARFEAMRIRQGDEVVVYGFPFAGALSSTGNTTTGNVSALSGLQDDTRLLQISAPIQPGNSGGPLMNNGGKVVGMVVGKLDEAKVYEAVGEVPQNVNFAIKGSVVLNFLEAVGVSAEAVIDDRGLSVADIAEMGRGFSVRVLCYK